MAADASVRAEAKMVAEAADLLKLMANPNRLAILCRLVKGEVSVGEMETTLGIRQPTLSQQLGELRKAGLVSDRREAKVVFYSLSDRRARSIVQHVHRLFCGTASLVEPAEPQSPFRNADTPRAFAPAYAAVFGQVLDRVEKQSGAA